MLGLLCNLSLALSPSCGEGYVGTLVEEIIEVTQTYTTIDFLFFYSSIVLQPF